MDKNLLERINAYIEKHYWYSESWKQEMEGVKFSYSEEVTWSEQLKKRFDFIFAHMEDTFAQRLWKIIQKKGLTDVEVYKKANLDRRLFSKIRNEKSYKPSKNTAIALVIALELDMVEADDLLSRAGYALSGGNKEDVIIQYFIESQQYNIAVINDVLDYYGFPVLGERKK